MTTITIDTNIANLPKTHFRDMDELAKVLLEWRFEQELEESVLKWMSTPTSRFSRA